MPLLFLVGAFFIIFGKPPIFMATILTTKEYAKKIKNCSEQAVRKAASKDKLALLPKVISFKKHGRDWLFEVAI